MIRLYKNNRYYATVPVKNRLPFVVGLPLDVRDKINEFISMQYLNNWFAEWSWQYTSKNAA